MMRTLCSLAVAGSLGLAFVGCGTSRGGLGGDGRTDTGPGNSGDSDGGADGSIDGGDGGSQGRDGGSGTDGCVQRTCEEAEAECGPIADGCGGSVNCGPCEGEEPCDATPTICEDEGWECGVAVDACGNEYDCGLPCGAFASCQGIPARCQSTVDPSECPLCAAVPRCPADSPTRLAGRVVTPGQSDGDAANQVGVPNAFVYILRTNEVADIPPIADGIPSDGTSCDRCSDQQLGPVLVGALTDARGEFTLRGNIPIGEEFLLVVRAGRFRRAVHHIVAAESACVATTLPTAVAQNPARLPRQMDDGLAVHIPKIAISTGQIDAMECVFYKMGLAQAEFGNPGSNARVHLYRGGSSANPTGARIDGSTPHHSQLYPDLSRLLEYDMLVSDCEGGEWDSSLSRRGNPSTAGSAASNLREYVNRGGRMFASHLSFTWLHQNGSTEYASDTAVQTGIGPAATFTTNISGVTNVHSGPGFVAFGRPNASPRLPSFSEWLIHEGVIANAEDTFTIVEPRSAATGLGTSTEEFVHCSGGNCTGTWQRTQQFSFATPYGAPASEVCGRVSYSGFHVVSGGGLSPFANATFPGHCSGNLSNQEKVLLYMLFDLGACVGEEPEPPECTPRTCADIDAECGTISNECGGTENCGPCPDGQVCGGDGPYRCGATCTPLSCTDHNAECGSVDNGCGATIGCGTCPPNATCTGNRCISVI